MWVQGKFALVGEAMSARRERLALERVAVMRDWWFRAVRPGVESGWGARRCLNVGGWVVSYGFFFPFLGEGRGGCGDSGMDFLFALQEVFWRM